MAAKTLTLRMKLLSALTLLTASIGLLTASAQVTPVAGSVAPTLPAGGVDVGQLPGSQPMTVILHLAPGADREAALLQFLTAVQTPGTATYHQWLNPVSFAQQFGAAQAQIDAVSEYAVAEGLSAAVSPSGLRITLTGTVAQVEAAFAPALHNIAIAGTMYFANTVAPTVPAALVADVLTIDGLDSLPSNYPMTLTGGTTTTVDDALAALAGVVDTNTSRVLAMSNAACLEDVSSPMQAAMQQVLRQASTQGITVLAATGCGGRGSAGFPSALSETTAVALAPGITPATKPILTELRPIWQQAPGLPSDLFRHEPDLTVSSLEALTRAVMTILTAQPAPVDGSAARLGNINATLYGLAPTAGLYKQPDNATAGTWEAATGLGIVDLDKLEKIFPRATGVEVNIALSVSPSPVTHGTAITFTAVVTDPSDTSVPAGTVFFSVVNNASGNTYPFGTGTLNANGTYSATTNSPSLNTLPGGSNTLTATYYPNDGVHAQTSQTYTFTVNPEAVTLAVAPSVQSVVVGGTYNVTVTASGSSMTAPPTGTVTLTYPTAYGTAASTQPLYASGTTSAATFSNLPALQANANPYTLSAVCNNNGDPSFTCGAPGTSPLSITQAGTTTTLTLNPTQPVTNVPEYATVSVVTSGPGPATGTPTPTGTVTIYDNGTTQVGSTYLQNNNSTNVQIQLSNVSGTVAHSFTAAYTGDSNYTDSKSPAVPTTPATAGTTTTLTSPTATSVVVGATVALSATVSPSPNEVNGVLPTGTVTFYSNLQGQIGSATIANGQSSVTTTSVPLTMQGTQGIYATFTSSDMVYTTSTSSSVTVNVGPTTSLIVSTSPTTISYGNTFTASVAVTATVNSGAGGPAGQVTFTFNGPQYFQQNATLTATGATTATATTQILQAPAPGTYTVTASCIGGNNFACNNVTSTPATFIVTKGDTTTTLSTDPSTPTPGSTVAFHATIAPVSANGSNLTFGGSVTFYDGTTVLGTQPVYGTMATLVTAISTASTHTFSAVYSGDTDWNGSSSTSTIVTGPTQTGTTLTVSTNSALAGSQVTLTATVANTTSTAGAFTATTVTFYDTYNNQTIDLGAEPVTASGTAYGVAQLQTTGLMQGTHSIFAVFNGSTTLGPSTSNVQIINITDYSITFTPASLTLNAGQSSSATATITALNGFAGQVVLGCTPPAGAGMTCSFNPVLVAGSGTSVLTVTTTVAQAGISTGTLALRRVARGVSIAALLLGFLLPGARRRKRLLLAMLMSVLMVSSVGCTHLANDNGATGITKGGTPLGTELLTITTSGTDGVTTNRHNLTYQVTIQ